MNDHIHILIFISQPIYLKNKPVEKVVLEIRRIYLFKRIDIWNIHL